MTKELLDWAEEAYVNYLTNFEEPICPPELDVHPDFYLPMTKEWFIKSLLEDNQRGEIFRQKQEVQFFKYKLTSGQRMDYWFKNNKPNRDVCDDVDTYDTPKRHKYFDDVNIPKYLILLSFNDTLIEIYE